MTIVEFLEARLAEDEQIATAASHPGWPWKDQENLGEWATDGMRALYAGGAPRVGNVIVATYDDVNEEFVRHMAQQDPSRALREVAAKRAIMAEHGIDQDPCDAHDAMYKSVPCDVILHLAAVYSSHPDYQQEWAL